MVRIYLSKMTKDSLNYPPWLEKMLEFTCLKWQGMRLNCPPWLEVTLTLYDSDYIQRIYVKNTI